MQNNIIKRSLFRGLCGFFLAVSVIAPGISGSVVAVLMGIYWELIEIVSNPFKNFKKNFFYLLPMGVGALLSFILLIKALSFLFDNYALQASALFIGLIAGSLPEIFKHANTGPFKWYHLAGIVGAFLLAGAAGLLARGEAARMVENADIWYLCLAGLVAGLSALVPGMSVSLILMLFGVYDYLLHVASNFADDLMRFLWVGGCVGICFIIGMVLFSNIIKLVFRKHSSLAYYTVAGFVGGTLISVFPKTMPDSALGWISVVLVFAAGLGVSGLFQILGKKLNVGGDEPKGEPQKEV